MNELAKYLIDNIYLDFQGGITLEAIQARHERVRTQVDGLTPAVSGEVTDDAKEAGDAAPN